jgi:hypothetical protein
MTEDRTPKPGLEPGEGGHAVGRDPRRMTTDELRAMGHEPKSPMQAIREHCLDCCAGSPNEVRLCTAVKCAKWPFRMGSSPWRAPLTEEQMAARKEAGRRLAAKRPGKSSEADKFPPSGSGTPSAATSPGRRRHGMTQHSAADPFGRVIVRQSGAERR